MKLSIALAAGALLASSALANAHSHLTSAQPAEGSVLNSAPANIVLKFSEATQVTALTLQKEGGEEQKLAPLPPTPAEEVSVATGKLTPGKYVVNWRVVSGDNHIM